jgi:RNA polymerase sigma-70 factor, ECF subfamily
VNADEFDRLVRLHLARLARLAVRIARSALEGEDLAQDALLRIARGWRGCRSAESFWPWVTSIVLNAHRDRLRRDKPVGPLQVEPAGRADEPVEQSIASETAERARQAVDALPPREREVIVLSVYEQMTPAEIAVATGLSSQNVRTTLAHARAKLRQQLLDEKPRS